MQLSINYGSGWIGVLYLAPAQKVTHHATDIGSDYFWSRIINRSSVERYSASIMNILCNIMYI